MALSDLPQIQALSPREKLQLAEELWMEVAQKAESIEVSPEEARLLDERWERYLSDPSSALTWEEFEQKLSARRA